MHNELAPATHLLCPPESQVYVHENLSAAKAAAAQRHCCTTYSRRCKHYKALILPGASNVIEATIRAKGCLAPRLQTSSSIRSCLHAMKHRLASISSTLLLLSSAEIVEAQTPASGAASNTAAAPGNSARAVQQTTPVSLTTSGADVNAAATAQGQAEVQPTSTADAPSTSASDLAQLKLEVAALRKQLDETSANSATTTDIAGLQTDVENFKYQYQRDRETKSATSTRNLLLGGIIQTRYSWYSETVTSPVPSRYQVTSVNNPPYVHDRKTTFSIPNAILNFNGLLYRDYESARNLQFQLSAAASPATSNAGLGANNINSFFTVLDANITYQVLPTIENDGARLSLKLGQFLVPFGLEANTTEELKPVIVNAQFVGATGFNLRNIGAVAHGEFFAQYDFGYNYRQALISFDVGAVNGNGPNRDDDNGHKDLFGRVAVTVPADYDSWLRELRVGASGYIGRQNTYWTPAAGTATPADGGYIGTGRRNRYGVDVYYNHFPFGVTYEHVWLDDELLPSNNVWLKRKGSANVATVFYSFGEQFLNSIKNQGKYDDWWPKTFQPFARFDQYDPDINVDDNSIYLVTLGLNIFFAETTKFQLNATRRVQQTAKDASTKSGEVLAQFQFGF